jgi:hypothetical protein
MTGTEFRRISRVLASDVGFTVENAEARASEWVRADHGEAMTHYLGTPDNADIETHALIANAALYLADMQHDLVVQLLEVALKRAKDRS